MKLRFLFLITWIVSSGTVTFSLAFLFLSVFRSGVAQAGIFHMRFHCVDQAGLELSVLLSQSWKG